jgi:membrane associated rhomboid family serine protease
MIPGWIFILILCYLQISSINKEGIHMIFLFPVLLLILMTAQPSYAYVGPGLGAGTIGAILGIVGSIFLALFAVIYYPIKRFLKKRKAKQEETRPTTFKGSKE